MSESLPKKRVLVLHGWTQNGQVFKEKIEPFCQECEKRGIELVFLDGTHGLSVDVILEHWNSNAAYAQDLGYDLKDPNLRAVLGRSDPRAWWNYELTRTVPIGHEETLSVVRKALEKQRFDGVFGYSQGGALAAITAAVLERPELYPSFMHDGSKPVHPPLQFCISVSGFRLIDPVTKQVLTPSFKTPTLHILGEKDAIIPTHLSLNLAELSENCRVIKHDGTHFVPLTASWTAFYCDFIENPSFDIPAPVTEDEKALL